MKWSLFIVLSLFTLSGFSQINLGRKHLKDRQPHINDHITKIVYDYNDGEHHTLGDTAHVYYESAGDLRAIVNDELLIVYHEKSGTYTLSHVYFGDEHLVEDDSDLAPKKHNELDDIVILEWEIDEKLLAVVLWKEGKANW
jgi:hypothetical protein